MAKIFRLQDNVPDVYVRKSRDFQLLCNLFDILNGGIKFDIDNMTDILDVRSCNDSLLPHLQTKLGFFTNKSLSSSELRTVLSSFKEIVKNKGSSIGIREAIEVYLKVINASKNSRVLVINKEYQGTEYDNISRLSNTYIVEVALEGQLVDVSLLDEILKYVLPAGYRLKYSFYESQEYATDIVASSDSTDDIKIIFVNQHENATIQPRTKQGTPNISDISNISTTRGVDTSYIIPQKETNDNE